MRLGHQVEREPRMVVGPQLGWPMLMQKVVGKLPSQTLGRKLEREMPRDSGRGWEQVSKEFSLGFPYLQ